MIARIALAESPPPEAFEAILAPLRRFNEEKAGREDSSRTLAVLVTDSESGMVIGGLWGRAKWGHLYVDLLFVPEQLRGTGLGTALMRTAEDEALRRGCHGAWLDTYSFQARGFYERSGYAVFGTIDDYPPGHSRFFMKKALRTAPA